MWKHDFIHKVVNTRSSAITEEPRHALCQLKSCQLLHSCTSKSHLKRLATDECASVRWGFLNFPPKHGNIRPRPFEFISATQRYPGGCGQYAWNGTDVHGHIRWSSLIRQSTCRLAISVFCHCNCVCFLLLLVWCMNSLWSYVENHNEHSLDLTVKWWLVYECKSFSLISYA